MRAGPSRPDARLNQYSPVSSIILAEILHKAGVPRGVFNLVIGDGTIVGAAIGKHPDMDAVSFTGSTRAGILVAEAAAPTVKRVTQELVRRLSLCRVICGARRTRCGTQINRNRSSRHVLAALTTKKDD